MTHSHEHTDDIRAAGLERWAEPDPMEPLEAEAPPERITVTLVGGPAHGREMQIRADRRRIETAYTTQDDKPLIRPDGMRPEPIEVVAVTLIYVRASEDALTAEYHDMEFQ